jgi:hypothetical protein
MQQKKNTHNNPKFINRSLILFKKKEKIIYIYNVPKN